MKITPDAVPDLANMDADALRQLVLDGMARQQALQDQLCYKKAKISKQAD